MEIYKYLFFHNINIFISYFHLILYYPIIYEHIMYYYSGVSIKMEAEIQINRQSNEICILVATCINNNNNVGTGYRFICLYNKLL